MFLAEASEWFAYIIRKININCIPRQENDFSNLDEV